MRLYYLMVLFPLIVAGVVFLFLWWWNWSIDATLWQSFGEVNIVAIPIVFLWVLIGSMFQKRLIFWYTWAKDVTRKEYPEIYNIVENLCISRAIPMPKIGIIEDQSMNAFATWWNPEKSRVVFSTWLLDQLDKNEIEAVAWHELTHIMNWDVKNMVIINVFIWAIGTIWYILMRTGWRWSKGKNPLPIIWFALYLIALILFPLVNMAISRKKEFIADAWSVDLTHNKDAMISALRKISGDPEIDWVKKQTTSVAAMFIENPLSNKKKWRRARMMATHPSVEDRIAALEMY
jgi:heat shock protein HtpX